METNLAKKLYTPVDYARFIFENGIFTQLEWIQDTFIKNSTQEYERESPMYNAFVKFLEDFRVDPLILSKVKTASTIVFGSLNQLSRMVSKHHFCVVKSITPISLLYCVRTTQKNNKIVFRDNISQFAFLTNNISLNSGVPTETEYLRHIEYSSSFKDDDIVYAYEPLTLT